MPKPDELTPREEQEPFLARWARLKEEAQQSPPQPVAEKAADPKAPAPELPAIDKLTLESDYRGFFHPKVGEDLRRAALRKLFSDPHFNVMDGLDVYIDDYSKNEPIPPAMLAGLRQAQNILQWAKEDEEERKRVAAERLAAQQQAAALEQQSSSPIPATPQDKPLVEGETPITDAQPLRGPAA